MKTKMIQTSLAEAVASRFSGLSHIAGHVTKYYKLDTHKVFNKCGPSCHQKVKY